MKANFGITNYKDFLVLQSINIIGVKFPSEKVKKMAYNY